ncbi:hypothetical protein R1flu_025624 [Riccia fluitans]|uniref:VWFA domain-containing protein n=1 Tax=Riccia fluitans TaxID=41844 RepID=A0ABD1XYG6_9MARC
MPKYVRAVFIQVLAIAALGIGLQIKQTSSQGTQGFSAQNQFDLLVSNIKILASKLGEIHSVLCPQNCACSQDFCQPLRKGSFTCFEPRVSNETNLYNCSSLLRRELGGNEKICSSIYVTNTSSVSYPRQSITSPPKAAQMSAICRTQELENVFVDISSQVPYFADYYVGMVDGSHRAFPGTLEEGGDPCLAYDSRKRPWYTGGINYANHLIILIDSGDGMTSNPILGNFTTSRLMLAKQFASALMGSVYSNNYINVFNFGGNNSLYKSSTRVSFTSADPESHPELQHLNDQINSITIEIGVETKPEDFVGALNITLKAFSDAVSDLASDALLNIILFTDGSFTQANGGLNLSNPKVAGIINQLQTRKVKLFIYGDPGKYDSDLQILSNSVNGVKNADTFVYLKQTDVNNFDPLFSMKSYFGYLAASSNAKYNKTPLWSPPYRDYFNVGLIVTVTMPSFSANKSFVGVAGIDIILEQLGSQQEAFKAIVTAQQNSLTAGSAMVSVPTTFDELCASPYKDVQDILCLGGSSKGDGKCCNTCGPSSRKKKIPRGAVVTGSVIGAPVGVVVLGFICWGIVIRWRKHKKTGDEPYPTEPLQPRGGESMENETEPRPYIA